MNKPRLIIPNEQYLTDYLEACYEYKRAGITSYDLHDPKKFDKWRYTIFDKYRNESLGIGLPDGYVPGTTYWLVDGDEWIGSGQIRHQLTEGLLRLGGHIGYGIRCTKWNQGYGTLQLKLLLDEAFRLGIDKALVTCNKENIGSARVIEKNDGVLQDIIPNVIDGTPIQTCRYWIDLGKREYYL